MASCPVIYDYVLDPDHYDGMWNLEDLWPSWVYSGLLFAGTFILPLFLIHLGAWCREQKQQQLPSKKEQGSETSLGDRESDWEDEGIPYVTSMADYLRTRVPPGYLEKFIEKQKKNGPPTVHIPGKTTVAVQTETVREQKGSSQQSKVSNRDEETQREEEKKSREKKASKERRTSRERRRTPSKSMEKSKPKNEQKPLSLQKTAKSESLHEAATKPSTEQASVTKKTQPDEVLVSDRTQESEQ